MTDPARRTPPRIRSVAAPFFNPEEENRIRNALRDVPTAAMPGMGFAAHVDEERKEAAAIQRVA
jgi:hypothetical protein